MSDAPAAPSPPSPTARIAFLDASVLYPATLRNLLMHLAVAGVFRPRWTDKVQDEWTTALLRDRPDLNAASIIAPAHADGPLHPRCAGDWPRAADRRPRAT